MTAERKNVLRRDLTVAAVLYGAHWCYFALAMLVLTAANSSLTLWFTLAIILLLILQSKVYDWIGEAGGTGPFKTRALLSCTVAACLLLAQFALGRLMTEGRHLYFIVDILYFNVIVFDIFAALFRLKRTA